MPASKAKKAEVAARRTQLIRLRRQFVPFDDPRILALGYKSRGAATKDMIRALEERRDEWKAEASVYRQEENERLDALLETAWPIATSPQPVLDNEGNHLGNKVDLRALETVLKLMERRAKLNGLDMPARTEISGPDGSDLPWSDGSLSTLYKLINTSGEAGHPHLDDAADAGPGEGESAEA